MDEVLKIIIDSDFEGNVEISSDSCFSGRLCFIAKEWYEKMLDDDEYKHKIGKDRILKVSGSTHRDRKTIWGRHRKMKEESLKEGVTEAEAKAIQVKYEEEFGLTEFNSR